jgi:methylisocitrate lyase
MTTSPTEEWRKEMSASAATRLRKMLNSGEELVIPGVDNCVTAKLVERAGFKVAYVSGFALSASMLGAHDMGLLTLTEMSTIEGNIAEAVGIPVIGDGEVGFGREINAARTVKTYEKLGLAGMQLDDIVEEVCPYIGEPYECAPIEKVVSKIKAIVDARKGDICLFVTCSADSEERRGEAEERIHAYMEAGADSVCSPAMNPADMEYWGKRTSDFEKPLFSVSVPALVWPFQSQSLWIGGIV